MKTNTKKIKTIITPETVLIDAIHAVGLDVDVVGGRGQMEARRLGITALRVYCTGAGAFDEIAIPKESANDIPFLFCLDLLRAEYALKAKERLMKALAIHLYVERESACARLYRPRVCPATQRGTVDGLLALLPVDVCWYPGRESISPNSVRSSKFETVGALCAIQD